MSRFFKRIIFLFCLSFIIKGYSQKREHFNRFDSTYYFGFHFDDDFLFLGNRDEQYTGGLSFEFLKKSQHIKTKRGVFNPFKNGLRYWNFTLGTSLYTPYNVSDSLIILNDRPFSSYIFLSSGYTAYSSDGRQKLLAELYLGFIGSSLPGKVQDAVHTIGDSPPAFGWDNRIAPCETFIPNLRLQYENTLFQLGGARLFFIDWWQLRQVNEVNAGLLFNNVSAGLRLSGFNYNPNQNAKLNFSVYKSGRSVDDLPKVRLETFFSAQLRLVAHNTTLQSLPWIQSPYVITPDLVNRTVWQLEGGLHITRKSWYFNYIVRGVSKEFKKYQKQWHVWAGLTVGKMF